MLGLLARDPAAEAALLGSSESGDDLVRGLDVDDSMEVDSRRPRAPRRVVPAPDGDLPSGGVVASSESADGPDSARPPQVDLAVDEVATTRAAAEGPGSSSTDTDRATADGPLQPVAHPAVPHRMNDWRALAPVVDRSMVVLALLLALAIVCVALVAAVIQKGRMDADRGARQASDYSAPPVVIPPVLPTVAIVGDDTTAQSASAVSGDRRWDALTAASLKASVASRASAGAGYVAQGKNGSTFGQQATEIPTDTAVVVFFGSANDRAAAPITIIERATEAFAAARTRAPRAQLVVVGPAIRGAATSSELAAIRNALQSAARIAGAGWFDPISDGWLGSPAQRASSGAGLSAGSERRLARRFDDVVSAALK